MGTGLYIHVPFCARACPYCDFDFLVGAVPATDLYMQALAREWSFHQPNWNTSFETVYIGGGTPSLIGRLGLERLLAWIRHINPAGSVSEVTVEINPEHGSTALFASLKKCGVSRISLGAQTSSEIGLRELGRMHTPTQVEMAIQLAGAEGLEVSVDLIVGWRGQTKEQLLEELQRLTKLSIDHISIYALTIESNTPWPKLVRRGLRVLPCPDIQAELLLEAHRFLASHGFEHYEVASYARSRRYSQHNSNYWRWGDYLGMGPSAHSAKYCADGGVFRFANTRGFSKWCEEPFAIGFEEHLNPKQAAAEGLWLGLRLLEGVDLSRFRSRFPGVDSKWVEKKISRQVVLGNLEQPREHCLRVSAERWLWHDSIAEDLLELGHEDETDA